MKYEHLIHQRTALSSFSYKPEFFDLKDVADQLRLAELLQNDPGIKVYDELKIQLLELARIRHPQRKLSVEEQEQSYLEFLNGTNPLHYGLWVYYPWASRLVHIVNKEEFIELRTSRNTYKITPEEKEILFTKKIGIIGLSVGQSIALTIAMERICSELRLADFDSVELSNMNRIRTGLSNLNIPKVYVAAREIAELDPFINVVCYVEGMTDENIDDFFTKNGKLDVLIEECDGLNIKILSRIKARQLGIPVVMDTNDRGMLDIERFDLEPDRPLFHGGLPDDTDISNLENLSNQEKLPLLDAMVDLSGLSERMKYSISEMGKTISTWPQLASSVVLGGAMVTDTCRRILLNQIKMSGRYYVDFEQIIK